jgi:hypothetical protein
MRDLLLGVGSYLVVASVFFGVITSAVDKNDKWEPPLLTIFIASAIWPLTIIAAIAYWIANWWFSQR